MSEHVIIHTDGGCIGNPGPGGWAAILQFGEHSKELVGRASHTTNNRMEMRAAIEALEALTRPCRVVIYTDSAYLRDGITKWVHNWQRKGWRTSTKQPVKNRDLWQRLLDAIERHQPAGGVSWEWLKGHAGQEMNDAPTRSPMRRATPMPTTRSILTSRSNRPQSSRAAARLTRPRSAPAIQRGHSA